MNPPDPLPGATGRLDLNLIAIFDALLTHRSVTRAARHLHVTQSAVSHALRKLRLFFDDPLFTKFADGVVPTPRAEELAPTIAGIMRTVRGSLLTAAAFDPSASRRSFTFVLHDVGELAVLPFLIQNLEKRAPACTIETVQADPASVAPILESGAADLYIGFLPNAPHDILHDYLYDHTSVVIASKRARIAGGALELEQYCRMRHVTAASWRSARLHVDGALEAMGLGRRIYLTTPHHLIIPFIVEQHADLIATVPRFLAETFAKKYAIRIFDLPLDAPALSICQYWHRRYDGDRAHRWLRGLVRETLYMNPKLHAPAGKRTRRRSRPGARGAPA